MFACNQTRILFPMFYMLRKYYFRSIENYVDNNDEAETQASVEFQE